MNIRDLILSTINAALYAVVGIATTIGVFAVVVGGVRFWPAVFIPAVFAEVFGPFVGGVGAAIGIFISDMIIHGNALVSLTIGVPANFIGFYILGFIVRRVARESRLWSLAAVMLQFLPLVALYYLHVIGFVDVIMIYTFIGVAIVSAFGIAFSMVMLMFRKRSYLYANEAFAYSLGLITGSLYIGLGLWLYTHISRLNIVSVPPQFQVRAPFAAALLWFLWTYYTEIPFMVYLAPPIVRAIEAWLGRYR